MLFSEPEAVNTRVRPSPSDMTHRKTATTRPIPRTVRVVVTFRTKRFRTLYFSGMPSIRSPFSRPASGRRRWSVARTGLVELVERIAHEAHENRPGCRQGQIAGRARRNGIRGHQY